MPEPKVESKSAKSKVLEVKVLGGSGDTSFVQYYDKSRGTVRVTIPTAVIQEGKVSLDELDMGIPPPGDIDWERIVLKPISSVSLAKAMHDEGIFTKQDLAEKRPVVLIVINRLSGLLLKDIFEQI